jgi:hypothetical protein
MLRKVRRKYNEWHYRQIAKGILDTAPIRSTKDAPQYVSLVCHRDLLPYLVAIKSVFSKIQKGQVVVLNDGSLTPSDLEILRHHLDDPQMFHVDDIDTGPCPSYICWSRLLLISDLVKDGYVVQVDSDIVAQSDVPEILECLEQDQGFMIVNPRNPGRVSFVEMTQWLEEHGWRPSSIQLRAEHALKNLPDPENRFYVRGTAAFVGFPKDSIRREDIYRFSQEVEPHVGEIWHNWGSEQTTTNHVVGNMKNLRLLEFPDYINHTPKVDVAQSKIVHFFGTHRFFNGRYVTSSRQAIRALQS